MNNVFDSLLGNTFGAGIDAPYQLDTVKGKDGFKVTAYASGTKGLTHLSVPGRTLELTTDEPTKASYYTGSRDSRVGRENDKMDGQSESVQNLTEGVMVLSEVGIDSDNSERSNSSESSESSIHGGCHIGKIGNNRA